MPRQAMGIPKFTYYRLTILGLFLHYSIFLADIVPDGGGYGVGYGDQDMSSIINTNNNDFIGVAIQYRVS